MQRGDVGSSYYRTPAEIGDIGSANMIRMQPIGDYYVINQCQNGGDCSRGGVYEDTNRHTVRVGLGPTNGNYIFMNRMGLMQRIDSNYKTSVIEGEKKSGNCTDGCCTIYTNDCSNTHGVFFAKSAMKTNMYTVGTKFQTGILRNTMHSQQPLIRFPLLPPAPVRCTGSNTNMLFHGDITIDSKSENSLVMGAKRKRVSFSENITSSQKPKTNSKQGMGARSKKSINRKKKQKETQTQTQKKVQEVITPVYLQHPKTTIFDVNNCPTATEIWPE